jgi:hypothetical protein
VSGAILSPLVLLIAGWALGYLFFGVPRLSLRNDDQWNSLVQQIAEGDASEWERQPRRSSAPRWLHTMSGIAVEVDEYHLPSSALLGAYKFTGPNGKPLPLCRAARLCLMRSTKRAAREQAKRTRDAEMMAVAEKLRNTR